MNTENEDKINSRIMIQVINIYIKLGIYIYILINYFILIIDIK